MRWVDVGRGLLGKEPVFRNAIQSCDDAAVRHAGWSVLKNLRSPDMHSPAWAEIVQPLVFAVQTAITALLASWGIVPDAVAGCGLGEVAAAFVSGALDIEQAFLVALNRGRLMGSASGAGLMAEVDLDYDRARLSVARWGGRVSIAAVDSPRSVTVSGEKVALEEFASDCERQGIVCRVLPADRDVHVRFRGSIRNDILERLKGVAPRAGSIPMFSTVTGMDVHGLALDPEYWARNAAEPVLISSAIGAMIKQDYTVFLDVSAHPILAGPIGECARQSGRRAEVVAAIRPELPEQESLLRSLGRLYMLGFGIRWSGLYPSKGRCVSLPPYPWQRQPSWIEAPIQKRPIEPRQPDAFSHALLGRHMGSPLLDGVGFEAEIGPARPSFLGDHRIGGRAVFPGAAFIEMAIAAGLELAGFHSQQSRPGAVGGSVPQIVLDGLSIRDALILPESGSCRIQTGLTLTSPIAQPFECSAARRAWSVELRTGSSTLRDGSFGASGNQLPVGCPGAGRRSQKPALAARNRSTPPRSTRY